MLKRLALGGIAIVLFFCAGYGTRLLTEPLALNEGAHISWVALALPGKALTLQDQSELQYFPFAADGLSAATLGTKGGAVTPPLLFWRIAGPRLVLSVTPEGDVVEELSAPTINGEIVTATRKSGLRSQYLVSSTRR